MTDVSLLLCCWGFIVCYAQENCSKFARWISPAQTKSGQRTASSETVVTFDAYLVRMLAIVCRHLAPAEFLVGCSPAALRAKFARLVHEAGLPKCSWKPYSLRRGGATISAKMITVLTRYRPIVLELI